MSKDGIYSPFRPIKSEVEFGVKVTDRYDLGQHSKKLSQDPVTTWYGNQSSDDQLVHFGWSFEPDDVRMSSCHDSWSMSKLYHTYGKDNFQPFWSSHSRYCEPSRALYHIRHGSEFPDLAEVSYGKYKNELYEIFTDGNGGFLLASRPEGSITDPDLYEVVLDYDFSLTLPEVL